MSGPVVYVDVHGTLATGAGEPIAPTVEAVLRLHAEGCVLYCWSSAGEDYARTTAEALGIAHLFRAFLTKPEVLLDDTRLHRWRGPVEVHPVEIAGRGRDFLDELLGR